MANSLQNFSVRYADHPDSFISRLLIGEHHMTVAYRGPKRDEYSSRRSRSKLRSASVVYLCYMYVQNEGLDHAEQIEQKAFLGTGGKLQHLQEY